MRNLVVIIVCAIMVACATEEGVKFANSTFDQAILKAQQENKMVLLDFYSTT